MTLYKYFNNFSSTLKNYKEILNKLQKFKSNKFYLDKEKIYSSLLNSDIRYLKHFVAESLNEEIRVKFREIHPFLLELTSPNIPLFKKIKIIDDLEFEWPEIDILLGKHKEIPEHYPIPDEIQDGEVKEDIQEAIRCVDGKNYLATLVMCRRAYESALCIKYNEIEKKEPVEDFFCPSCKKRIIKDKPLGITKLHRWAIEKGIVPKKLDNVGYIVPNLGAGGAHYSKDKLPRDIDIAKISITTTITLVKSFQKSSPIK